MVFDIKLIAAGVITVGLLGAFLLSNSTVGNFIKSVDGKTSDFQELNNVSFVMNADRYEGFEFEKQKNLSLDISGKTSGDIGDGLFETENGITIGGFDGKGKIDHAYLILNGSLAEMELADAKLSFKQKKYDSASEFSSASIENLMLKEFGLENATGTLSQGDAEIRFTSSTVLLEEVSGKFSFGNNITIEGHAKKISIPKSGIRIE